MATFLYRLGRFAYRRRGLVSLLWLGLLVVFGVGAATLSGPTSNSFSIPGTQAQETIDLLQQRFPQVSADGATARVVFAAPPGQALTDPAAKAAIVQGHLTDNTAIDEAIAGANAVISVLGPSTIRAAGSSITDGTKAIIAAMKTHGVKRLVASATFSATDPRDTPPLPAWLMIAWVKRLAPAAYRDIIGTSQAVRESGLDWTLVRVGLLRNKPRTGRVAAAYLGKAVGRVISRENFAGFMLRQAIDRTWIRKAPAISDER